MRQLGVCHNCSRTSLSSSAYNKSYLGKEHLHHGKEHHNQGTACLHTIHTHKHTCLHIRMHSIHKSLCVQCMRATVLVSAMCMYRQTNAQYSELHTYILYIHTCVYSI